MARTLKCDCGEVLTGQDDDELFRLGRQHIKERRAQHRHETGVPLISAGIPALIDDALAGDGAPTGAPGHCRLAPPAREPATRRRSPCR